MMVEQDLAEDFLDKSFLLYLSDVPIKSGACPVDIVHSRLYHLFMYIVHLYADQSDSGLHRNRAS